MSTYELIVRPTLKIVRTVATTYELSEAVYKSTLLYKNKSSYIFSIYQAVG